MYLKERKGESTKRVTTTIRQDYLDALKYNGENINRTTNILLEDYCRELQHKSIHQVAIEAGKYRGRDSNKSKKVNLRLRSDLVDYLNFNGICVGGVLRHLIAAYVTTLSKMQVLTRVVKCYECQNWNPDEEQCDHPDMPPCDDNPEAAE